MVSLFHLLRPVHWLKNMLVFLPMAFAQLFTAPNIVVSLQAFFIFCLAASCVYAMNDLLDAEHDRAVPAKRVRPVAADLVTQGTAAFMSAGLFLLTLLLSVWLMNEDFIQIILVYFLCNLLYFFYAKKTRYLDVILLSFFYVLRVLAGAAAIAIDLSLWLFSFSLLFFLCLSAIKRLAEIADSAAQNLPQVPGRTYVLADQAPLRLMAYGAGGGSVGIMLTYALSDKAALAYALPSLFILNAAILCYWIWRMINLSAKGALRADPIDYVLKDPVSLACILGVLGITALAIFYPL